jgi:amino acid permease
MLGYKLNFRQNLMWTLIIVAVSCVIASPVKSIGTIMTILGATTNSAIGFLLPIAFYLKHERKTPRYTNDKIACYALFVFICFSSVAELTTFTLKTLKGNGDKN